MQPWLVYFSISFGPVRVDTVRLKFYELMLTKWDVSEREGGMDKTFDPLDSSEKRTALLGDDDGHGQRIRKRTRYVNLHV